MRVTVHNAGEAPYGLYDERGRLVTVAPGETIAVDLAKSRINRNRSGLVIAASDEAVRPDDAVTAEEPPQQPDVDIDALRAEAERLDIDVDGRWGAATLQRKIAEAKAVAGER